jgi:AraC-like DNA-binding protein
MRFQQVLHTLEDARQRIELADIALSCGYYDQAHFAHDFLAFSGINPTTYLRQRTAHMSHVPMTD